jgi:hypothetical protein
VDGQQLGTIHEIDIEPTAKDSGAGAGPGAPVVHMTVRASDSLAGGQFEHCLLVPSSARSYRRLAEFKCLTPKDSAGAGLRKLGEIVVQPGGAVLDILVPDSQLARWQRTSADDIPAVKRVRIQADSNGAVIDVRDRGGRKLFRLEADSGGARISVHGDSSARAARR